MLGLNEKKKGIMRDVAGYPKLGPNSCMAQKGLHSHQEVCTRTSQYASHKRKSFTNLSHFFPQNIEH